MDSVTKKDIDKIIGKILKEYRIKSNLTQEDLAEKLGISFKYISRIENGNNGVKTETLINYMRILSISPNILFKQFLEDTDIKKDLEISEKISALSESKKEFLINVIEKLNDL